MCSHQKPGTLSKLIGIQKIQMQIRFVVQTECINASLKIEAKWHVTRCPESVNYIRFTRLGWVGPFGNFAGAKRQNRASKLQSDKKKSRPQIYTITIINLHNFAISNKIASLDSGRLFERVNYCKGSSLGYFQYG